MGKNNQSKVNISTAFNDKIFLQSSPENNLYTQFILSIYTINTYNQLR